MRPNFENTHERPESPSSPGRIEGCTLTGASVRFEPGKGSFDRTQADLDFGLV
jgi:hypothetical protein